MNAELQLKLQSWVDGELSDDEARRMAELVNTDKEAHALVAELRLTKGFLASNEIDVKLPESREFYWGKIQREIECLEQAPHETNPVPWLAIWRRTLAPLSGLALIAFVSVLSINLFQRSSVDDPLRHLVEVENLSDEMASISYRSQSDNMFVVYLYAKDKDSQGPTDSNVDFEPEWMDDTAIQ